jgi:hypothetical protein
VNRCSSWLGHKFEARYDIRPQIGGNFEGVSSVDVVAVVNAQAKRDYVRDVCIRCGATVERSK